MRVAAVLGAAVKDTCTDGPSVSCSVFAAAAAAAGAFSCSPDRLVGWLVGRSVGWLVARCRCFSSRRVVTADYVTRLT